MNQNRKQAYLLNTGPMDQIWINEGRNNAKRGAQSGEKEESRKSQDKSVEGDK